MQQTCSLDISSSSEFPRRNTKLRIQYSVESSIFLYPNCSLAYPFFFFLFLPWFLWVLVILNYSLLGSSSKYTTKDGGLVCIIVNKYYCQKHRIWFWWRIFFFKQLDWYWMWWKWYWWWSTEPADIGQKLDGLCPAFAPLPLPHLTRINPGSLVTVELQDLGQIILAHLLCPSSYISLSNCRLRLCDL